MGESYPNQTPPNDELSLRDVYLVLRRWSRFILVFTLSAVLLTFLVSLLLPKTYVSKVTLSLGLNTASLGGSSLTGQLLSNLPSLSGLASGFNSLLDTNALTKDLGDDLPSDRYKASFDEKKSLFTLTAKGGTPREALENTQKFSQVTRQYFTDRISSVISTNVDSLLTRSRLDLAGTKENLRLLQETLKTTPKETRTLEILPLSGANGSSSGQVAARGVNPAYSALSVQEATLRTSVAQTQALIDALERVRNEPAETQKLVAQALQLQEIVPAAEPLRADFPRPTLYAALAGVLALLISLIVPFIAEAIRDPNAARREEQERALEPSTRVPSASD